MSRDLQLLGRARRSHDGYLREVRKLACYFKLSPDQLSQRPARILWGAAYLGTRLHGLQSACALVVPGGGVSTDGSTWKAAPENFLLPEKAAAKIYPGKFREAMRAAGLEQQFKDADSNAWFGQWTVDVQAVGDGRAALKYLAPYINRVAISNKRIVAVDSGNVTYRYTPSRSRHSVKRTVSGQEFVRGFLQHTLPSKFQRLRYYGWSSPNCKLKFQYVQMLVWFYLGWCWLIKQQEIIEPLVPTSIPCNRCGVGTMHLTKITNGDGAVIYRKPLLEHSVVYLDSG